MALCGSGVMHLKNLTSFFFSSSTDFRIPFCRSAMLKGLTHGTLVDVYIKNGAIEDLVCMQYFHLTP